VRNLGLRYQVMACYAEARLEKFDLKWDIMVQYMFEYRDMINYGLICSCSTICDQYCQILSGLIILMSLCQVSVKAL